MLYSVLYSMVYTYWSSPYAMSCGTAVSSLSDGIANPKPLDTPPAELFVAAANPTTRPTLSTTGPPLAGSDTGASVCTPPLITAPPVDANLCAKERGEDVV